LVARQRARQTDLREEPPFFAAVAEGVNGLNAVRSILESWQRSALSATGIMVASVAILLLVSIGQGVEKDITGQVEELGANVLVCVPGKVDAESMTFNPNLGGQSWFKPEHGRLLESVPGVRQVATLSFAGGGLRLGKKEAFPLMVAATPNWFSVHQVKLEEGSFYTDQASSDKVVVLGAVAKAELFGAEQAVGKEVEVNGKPFRVIGVLEDPQQEQSLFSSASFQNVAYIPLSTHLSLSPGAQIDRFMVQSSSTAEPKPLVKALEDKLATALDRQQFSVLTQEDLLGLIFSVMSILSTLVVGLTSIALFVGGMGILTVMVMSVNERRKEIGVLKAVGATRRDVFQQFLIEAVIIGVVGVMAGLVISMGVNAALAAFTKIKPLMTPETVLLAFGVGVGVGALAGLFPAMQAARQDPVVSLRSE
jgi:putative ABC transport system permease protein